MSKTKIIFGREIMYSDGCAAETAVRFDSSYRLGNDDQSYVKIEGVGEPAVVRVDHIPQLIEWLQEVARLDNEARK